MYDHLCTLCLWELAIKEKALYRCLSLHCVCCFFKGGTVMVSARIWQQDWSMHQRTVSEWNDYHWDISGLYLFSGQAAYLLTNDQVKCKDRSAPHGRDDRVHLWETVQFTWGVGVNLLRDGRPLIFPGCQCRVATSLTYLVIVELIWPTSLHEAGRWNTMKLLRILFYNLEASKQTLLFSRPWEWEVYKRLYKNLENWIRGSI